MSDEPALLKAILADPEDDTPRLVYADWLQEQGQGERAEFIRVQVELARIPELRAANAGAGGIEWIRSLAGTLDAEPSRPAYIEDQRLLREFAQLRERERELEQLNESRGWGGVFLFGGDGALWSIMERMEEEPIWRRGFIAELHAGTDGCDMSRVLQLCESPHVVLEQLTCTAADWLQHGDAICATHPVTKVRLTTADFGWDYHAASGRSAVYPGPASLQFAAGHPDEPGYRFRLLSARWPRVTFTLPEGTP